MLSWRTVDLNITWFHIIHWNIVDIVLLSTLTPIYTGCVCVPSALWNDSGAHMFLFTSMCVCVHWLRMCSVPTLLQPEPTENICTTSIFAGWQNSAQCSTWGQEFDGKVKIKHLLSFQNEKFQFYWESVSNVQKGHALSKYICIKKIILIHNSKQANRHLSANDGITHRGVARTKKQVIGTSNAVFVGSCYTL